MRINDHARKSYKIAKTYNGDVSKVYYDVAKECCNPKKLFQSHSNCKNSTHRFGTICVAFNDNFGHRAPSGIILSRKIFYMALQGSKIVQSSHLDRPSQ